MNVFESLPRSAAAITVTPPRAIAGMPAWSAAAERVDALEFLMEGLDCLAHGVALLDADSSVVYANVAARSLFEQAGWQIACDGVLRNPRASVDESWRVALRQASLQGRRQLVELMSDDGAQYVALTPVVVGGVARIFVTGGRRELCGQPELQLYATQRGLTGAENQVLSKLAVGLKPAQIAQAHGVALSTILTQVAAVRQKTMAASIRHLQGIVARLPPLRPRMG